jgi:hypothetical protein
MSPLEIGYKNDYFSLERLWRDEFKTKQLAAGLWNCSMDHLIQNEINRDEAGVYLFPPTVRSLSKNVCQAPCGDWGHDCDDGCMFTVELKGNILNLFREEVNCLIFSWNRGESHRRCSNFIIDVNANLFLTPNSFWPRQTFMEM